MLKIKEFRVKAGLTQEQLAKKMNVDQSCVSLWESERTTPARKLHKKLARVLGVTAAELEGNVEQKKGAQTDGKIN